MITIGGVGSAGGASSYYAKDNYYTNSQGLGTSEWYSKGAEILGLPSGSESTIKIQDSEDLAEKHDVSSPIDADKNNQAETVGTALAQTIPTSRSRGWRSGTVRTLGAQRNNMNLRRTKA